MHLAAKHMLLFTAGAVMALTTPEKGEGSRQHKTIAVTLSQYLESWLEWGPLCELVLLSALRFQRKTVHLKELNGPKFI